MKKVIQVKNKKALTLAEMMVVLFILSLVTAAIIPIITKETARKTIANSILVGIWKQAANNSDIYFGTGTEKTMIGVNSSAGGEKAGLIINTPSATYSNIAFQENGSDTGKLIFDGTNNNLIFGTTTLNYTPTSSIAIGKATTLSYSSMAIGAEASGSMGAALGGKCKPTTTGTGIGYNAAAASTSQFFVGANVCNGVATTGGNAYGCGVYSGMGVISYVGGYGFGSVDGNNLGTYLANPTLYPSQPSVYTKVGGNAYMDPGGNAYAIGVGATAFNSSSYGYMIALGANSNATKGGSTAIGYGARSLYDGNTVIGCNSGTNTVGSLSTHIGSCTFSTATGTYTGTTTIAATNTLGLLCDYQTEIISGQNTGNQSTSNYSCIDVTTNGVGIGFSAGTAIPSVTSGVAIGRNAKMYNSNQPGIAIGKDTDAPPYGISIRGSSVSSTPPSYCVNVGGRIYKSGSNGDYASCLGFYDPADGYDHGALATQSCAFGYNALASQAATSGNTAMGYNAKALGQYSLALGSGSQATNSNCIAIGTSSRADGGMAIGHRSTAGGGAALGAMSTSDNGHIAIGTYAQATDGYNITIGTVNEAVRFTYDLWASGVQVTSDKRLKNIKGRFQGGLNEIKKMQPYTFTFKKDKHKKPFVGVIAQDLIKIFPDAVMVNRDYYFSIRDDDIFYSMLNAIKELDNKLQILAGEIKTLFAKVKILNEKIIILCELRSKNSKNIKQIEKQNQLLANENKFIKEQLIKYGR